MLTIELTIQYLIFEAYIRNKRVHHGEMSIMVLYQTKLFSLPTSELNSKKASPFSYFTHYLF